MQLSDRTSTYLFTTPVLILSCLRTAAVLLSDMADVRKVADGGTEVSTKGTEGKAGEKNDDFGGSLLSSGDASRVIRSDRLHTISQTHPLGSNSTVSTTDTYWMRHGQAAHSGTPTWSKLVEFTLECCGLGVLGNAEQPFFHFAEQLVQSGLFWDACGSGVLGNVRQNNQN